MPKCFWISGFFFTQSFFTGVLQQYARKTGISIDKLEFRHEVQHPEFKPAAHPEDGCFIHGLFMEGGKWEQNRNFLGESVLKEIYSLMPPVR